MMPRVLWSYSIAAQGTPATRPKITEWKRVPRIRSALAYSAKTSWWSMSSSSSTCSPGPSTAAAIRRLTMRSSSAWKVQVTWGTRTTWQPSRPSRWRTATAIASS